VKPLLIGELNPYGADPGFALYPLPEHASGGRLARILGLSRGEYLRRFDRVNLCTGKWSMRAARTAAAQLHHGEKGDKVLLGAKVCKAFKLPYTPFSAMYDVNTQQRYYILPHPSGLNRIWNEPGSAARARELLKPILLRPMA
jgi:hypothetical protein